MELNVLHGNRSLVGIESVDGVICSYILNNQITRFMYVRDSRMIPSSTNSGNRAAYKRSTSVLGNCESRIQTSSMIEVRFCLKWRVSCTSDAHKELETYLSLFISLTLNRHCIILEYEKRKMWRSLHVLWQVSFISSYVHRIL